MGEWGKKVSNFCVAIKKEVTTTHRFVKKIQHSQQQHSQSENMLWPVMESIKVVISMACDLLLITF